MTYAQNRHTHYLHKMGQHSFETLCGYYVSENPRRWRRLQEAALPVRAKLCRRCFKVAA